MEDDEEMEWSAEELALWAERDNHHREDNQILVNKITVQETEHLGLDTSHGCPNCRDCSRCKRGDAVESIPLKEDCLLYTSPSPRDKRQSRMPSSA